VTADGASRKPGTVTTSTPDPAVCGQPLQQAPFAPAVAARAAGAVPGRQAMPLLGPLGNLAGFMLDPVDYVGRLFRDYGPIAALVRDRSTWIVSTTANPPGSVFVQGPELNHQIFSQHAVYDKSALSGPLYPQGEPRPRTRVLRRLLTGLFDVNGERHRTERRLLMPAFHKKRIEGYRDDMVAISEDVLARFVVGETRDVAKDMNELALRVATRTLFGAELGSAGLEVGRALQRWLDLFRYAAALPLDWPGLPYRRWLDVSQSIDAEIVCILRNKRAAPKGGTDIISALLEATDEHGVGLTEDELIGHASVLFAAGHETSSNALSWTLALLSQHPATYAALHAELESKLGGRAPLISELAELPVLDGVVKESLRLLPPAPFNHRVAAADTELGGCHIARGTEVISSAYHTHRMPEIFTEPQRFMPERWSTLEPGPYAYNPFGGGPRLCIGASFAQLEIKIALSLIVQRFRLELPRGRRVDRALCITMRPKGGLPMNVHRQDGHFERNARGVRGDLARMVDFST
jgi:cytochrome P450